QHASENAHGYARLLCAIDIAVGPTAEIAIVGDPSETDTRQLLDTIREEYLPRVVVATTAPDQLEEQIVAMPLFAGRGQIDDQATAFVCINYACQLPTTDPSVMLEQIQSVMQTDGS